MNNLAHAPVIFDMDGVLVDSEPVYEAAFRSYMADAGRPELGDWYPHTIGRREIDYLAELSAMLGRGETEVAAGLLSALGPRLDEPLRPMPHAHDALAAIAAPGRPIGLASSSSRHFVDHMLDSLQIRDAFHVIITGDDVSLGKPAPDIYLLAARALEVAASDCVAIEDSPAGVTAANRAGMWTVAIPNALSPPQGLTHADRVVDSLADAADLLGGR